MNRCYIVSVYLNRQLRFIYVVEGILGEEGLQGDR
jgi:hypothetical protein